MKKPREIRKCPMSYQNLESQWNCGLASYPRCSVSGRRKRKGLSMCFRKDGELNNGKCYKMQGIKLMRIEKSVSELFLLKATRPQLRLS